MGKRGPLSQSGRLLRLKGGESRARRREAAAGSGWPAGAPKKPADLSPGAAAVWDQLVVLLANVLAPMDGLSLRQLCEAAAMYRTESAAYWAADDERTRGAAFKRMIKSQAAAAELAREFGLTPRSRSRMPMPMPTTPTDETRDLRYLAENREPPDPVDDAEPQL